MHQCFVWEFPSPFICSIQLSYFQSMTCAICVYFYICVVPYRLLLPKELIMLPFMFFWHKFQLISSLFLQIVVYISSLRVFLVSLSRLSSFTSPSFYHFISLHLHHSLPSSLFHHLCSFISAPSSHYSLISLFLDLSIS